MPATNPAAVDFLEDAGYEKRFADVLDCIQRRLTAYLEPAAPESFAGPDRLWEALRYAVLDGGKRIRPVLAVETCLACGGGIEAVLPAACAIELVHAQSLIHDDLPCMDNDDLRRGKPTLHRAFDEATAVLAGDALIAMAFGLISRHTPQDQVPAATLLRVITDFSDVASLAGLVNGQYVDIYYEKRPFTPEILRYIHTYKTGALFRFSTRAGALLAGAEDGLADTLTRFGEKLGLAFQIVDDLLDIQSTPEALGKTPGKDRAQQKATYPALYGEAGSREKAQGLIAEAENLLSVLPADRTASLRALARFISVRIR